MAEVKLIRTYQQNINNAPLADGTLYVAKDSRRVFLDFSDCRRELCPGSGSGGSSDLPELPDQDGDYVLRVTTVNGIQIPTWIKLNLLIPDATGVGF